MSSLPVAAIVFGVVFTGAIFGQRLSLRLCERHRSPETHDAIKLTTGMLSVLAALVLGLLTASLKNAFDATDSQIRQFAATSILLNAQLRLQRTAQRHGRGCAISWSRGARRLHLPDH